MATKEGLKDLDLSSDEVERLTKAFKNDEFKKLFFDYAQEIADPENRKRYEDEIRQMEGDRGMDVQFVHPEPGYVVKTTVDGDQKAFINICKNENIDKPSSEKSSGPDGQRGLSWKLPHSFAPPRDDMDKHGTKCKVFDFVVHPDTYRMAESNARFKKMLHDTAFDGIERQFNLKLDKKNIKFPKTKFKGTPTATVIRNKASSEEHVKKKTDPDDIMNNFPYPYDTKTSAEKASEREEAAKQREATANLEAMKTTRKPHLNGTDGKIEDEFTIPMHSIKHRTEFDMQDFRNDCAKPSRRPTSLVVEIELPLLTSAGQLDLDIFEKHLTLQSLKPAKYKLDLNLPYPVDENEGSAKFDKAKRKLVVTVPVIPQAHPDQSVNCLTDVQNDSDLVCESEANSEVIMDEKRINNGFHDNEDAPKPLIEVLSSVDDHGSQMEERDVEEPEDNFELPSPQVHYMMPAFDFQQDDETVSIILHSGGVTHDSIEFEVDDDNNGCEMFMTSLGSGGFPVYYKLVVRFCDDNILEPNRSRVEVSNQNVVLVLVKDDSALGAWEKFHAGLELGSLEEKVFVTASVLRQQIDQLERDTRASETEVTAASAINVTDLNSRSLKLDIQAASASNADGEDESPASDHDIEVVHSNELPKLHSILKQRGRTQSESSCDDVLSSSYGRQHSSASMCSESSLIESDDNTSSGSSGGLRKKCVSFSESIDRTTYKTTASVSSMTQALKSKRRRQRKREARFEHKLERRRRKSSGSEFSSDDLSSSPEINTMGSAQLGVGEDQSPGVEGDIEADMDEEFDRAIDAALEASAVSDTMPESDEGKRTYCGDADSESEPAVNDGNVHAVSSGAVVDVEAAEENDGDVFDVQREGVGVVSNEGEDDALRTNTVVTNTVVTNTVVTGSDSAGAAGEQLDEDDDEEGDGDVQPAAAAAAAGKQNLDAMQIAAAGDGGPSKAETSLSWNDAPPKPENNEHKTECAFQFSNSVMFDLDEE